MYWVACQECSKWFLDEDIHAQFCPKCLRKLKLSRSAQIRKKLGLRRQTDAQKAGRKEEIKEAKRRDARPTRGSGSQGHDPGDIDDGEYLIEHKFTEHKSFSVKKETWEKIAREAHQQGRTPMMVLNISGLRLEVREAE